MLKAALARYRSFVREPDVARLMAMALIARMPLGTLSFAMLMHVRDFTGSFADAGIAVGAYYAAAAAFSPLIGRIVDRRGPKGVLLVTGIVCPLALLVIVVARPFGISLPIVVTAAAVAGAFAPPITVLTRTMWRYRFDDEAVRKIAFTLDGVLIELAFTLGPVLIAALIAIASPSVAFAAAWGFVTLSVPTFIASPALKYWRHEPHAERHLLGPLTDSRLIVIYLSTMLMTASFGFLEVGLPGFATAAGAPALGGVLIAINSIGSVIGGLAYGGLHLALPVERQLKRLLGLLAVPLFVAAFAGTTWQLAALAFVNGVFITPAFAIFATLISVTAPSRYATEAFTWSATFIVCGISAGMAIGGAVVEHAGASTVFLLAGVVATASAACSFALRERSVSPQVAP
jgi:MFS family permease